MFAFIYCTLKESQKNEYSFHLVLPWLFYSKRKRCKPCVAPLSAATGLTSLSFSVLGRQAKLNEEVCCGATTLHPIVQTFNCIIKSILRYKLEFVYIFNKFITSVVITSFSSGFDSAIISVIATSAPSLITF